MSQQTQAQAIEEDRRLDIDFVLSNHRGRAFVWNLLAQSQVFAASFTGEALTSAFAEGKRDIGLRILRDAIECDPNILGQMNVEDKERQTRYLVSRETTEEDDYP